MTMRSLRQVSLGLAGALALSTLGCAGFESRLTSREKKVGTSNKGDWLLHRIPEERHGLGLKVPGYIFGFEKTERVGKLDLESLEDCRQETEECRQRWHASGVRMAEGTPALEKYEYSEACQQKSLDRRNRNLADWLSDPQHAFLTHVVRYSYEDELGLGVVWPQMLYDAYSDEQECSAGQRCKRLFSDGRDLLEDKAEVEGSAGKTLRDVIAQDVTDREATHILLYTMGWNTDQEEAVRNFNSLIGELLEVEREAESGFRPLVVGVTWDSVAGTPLTRLFTYAAKANDADEVGTVWVSRLIWNILAPVAEDTGAKLVVVGHSFGARVLLQALHARPHLPEPGEPGAQVDLALMYQGAVSVNRFLPEHGLEGGPYAGYEAVAGKVALTWSKNDKANPKAKLFSGAKHLGGEPGYERARQNRHVFDLRVWNGEEVIASDEESDPKGSVDECIGERRERRNKILMIDASEAIRFSTHRKGGKAHSDIYNEEVAALTWWLLGEHASTPQGEPEAPAPVSPAD